jgi:flavin-dependent dehydrogenase
MIDEINNVVIVGGGTAGWLTAALIAARHPARDDGAPGALSITLIESPDTPSIGVGEGTWPTMRNTLARIGIAEPDFLGACDASFKQGSRFDGWLTGAASDSYLHPFVPPISAAAADVHAAWKTCRPDAPFADAVCVQGEICAQNLAPKLDSMPDYEGALNYAYHLDAAKLAALLTRHSTEKLGVRHIRDHVTGVASAELGDIAGVHTRENGLVAGDFFVDCTGLQSLLLGGHFAVPFRDQSHTLFNDAALAVQVPERPAAPIASQTISTAHDAGWIWDIGLPTRRGIGLVYASAFMSDSEAEASLRAYLTAHAPHASGDGASIRKIAFQSGYRERFWRRNCVAIGLSAGFLEPLEASAIVMIELSAKFLADHFPRDRVAMGILEKRFNELFAYRWGRTVDFLKLHYCLSRRAEPYWQANCDEKSIPERLGELLRLWARQPPSALDFPHAEEMFPAASHQYVYYGMGGETRVSPSFDATQRIAREFELLAQRRRKLVAGLPTNRALLSNLNRTEARQEMLLEGQT